ncbi:MAG: hypothetical protein ACI93L_002742 [Cyclobacteriaceae bacterium]|jgi:hypothetical protein
MKAIILISLSTLLSACPINKYQLAGDNKDFLINQIDKFSQEGHISSKPILVVDSIEYVKSRKINLQETNLTKERIKEIELLKKDPAIRIFGNAGKRGVLVITSKSAEGE